MWPLKRRKSKAPPASTCYFCSAVQSQLSPSSGSVHRFICSSCGSYNAIQPDGFSPIDNDRPALHFDSSLPANARSLSHKAVSTTHMTSIMTADRLYCSTCRQHQSLQTYLLASYFDNVQEGSDEDRLLRERLPEYRASLQERYPLLCPTCQPDVLEELKKRNSCARASILNQYMIRSRPDSPSLSEKKFEGRHQRKGRRDKRATLRWRLQGLAWMLKGLIWGVLQLMTLLCALKGALQPSMLQHVLSRISFIYLSVFIVVSFPFSFWQPRWNRYRRTAAVSPDPRRVHIKGKQFWISVCLTTYVLRLVLLALPRFLSSPDIVQTTSVATVPVFCVSIILGFQRLDIATAAYESTFSCSDLHVTPQKHQPRPSTQSTMTPPAPPNSAATPSSHPLFGDWRAAQQAAATSAEPMDLDEGHKPPSGNAGQHATGLESLFAGSSIQQRGPFHPHVDD